MSESRRRIARPISFTPEHEKALRWLTEEVGDSNMSASVRRLIEAEMRKRFGPNWLTAIERESAVEPETASVA